MTMTRRVRLGMLTPSSNTVLKPVTMAMPASLPDVSAHFSRFKVTEIARSEQALGPFDDSEILCAAELLRRGPRGCDRRSGTRGGAGGVRQVAIVYTNMRCRPCRTAGAEFGIPSMIRS
jgi:hypothetical protein